MSKTKQFKKEKFTRNGSYWGKFSGQMPLEGYQVELQKVSRWLDVPSSLLGVFTVAENLKEIIPYLRQLGSSMDEAASEIKRWVSLTDCEHPFREVEHFIGVEKIRKEGVEKGKLMLNGVIKESPVWAAMLPQAGTSKDNVHSYKQHLIYRRLQSLLLACKVRSVTFQEVDVHARIEKSGLLIRRLHVPSRSSYLDRMDGKIGTFKEAYQLFYEIGHKQIERNESEQESPEEVDQRLISGYFREFATLLTLLFGVGDPSKIRTVTPVERTPGERRSGGRDTSYTDLDPDHPMYQRLLKRSGSNLQVRLPGKEVSKEIERKGGAPGEYVEPIISWISIEGLLGKDKGYAKKGTDPKKKEKFYLPPIGSLHALARARQRAQVMQAQHLVTALDRIRPDVLKRILEVLEELYPQSSEHNALKESLFLAGVSLVTGAQIEEVIDLKVIDGEGQVGECGLYYHSQYNLWIRSYEAPERKERRSDLVALNGVKEQLYFPDCLGVGEAIYGGLCKKGNGVVFEYSGDEYKTIFREFVGKKLIEVGVERRWRSLSSMSRILPSWFNALEEGDQLRVAALFGRKDPSAIVHRHYTRLERNQLSDLYRNRFLSLWSKIKVCGFKERDSALFSWTEAVDERVKSHHSYVGDELAPNVQGIRELLYQLRQKIESFQQQSTIESMVQYHNLVVSYMALLLSVVTGLRPVRTPITDLTVIDKATGLMPLQEKDEEGGVHARIVWLTDLVRKQISEYITYLRVALIRFSVRGLPSHLNVPATKYRDHSRFNQGTYSIPLNRTLFFLEIKEDELHASEWVGDRLVEQLQESLSDDVLKIWAVGNSGRHFIRSYLVECGCPATIINAFMGHWGTGEEMWAPYSAFDPLRYRKMISRYLKELDEALGVVLLRMECHA